MLLSQTLLQPKQTTTELRLLLLSCAYAGKDLCAFVFQASLVKHQRLSFQLCTFLRISPLVLAVVLLVFLSPTLCHFCHCDSWGLSGALKILGAHRSLRWLLFNLARLSGMPQHWFGFFSLESQLASVLAGSPF